MNLLNKMDQSFKKKSLFGLIRLEIVVIGFALERQK
jgi:hypothetical protein